MVITESACGEIAALVAQSCDGKETGGALFGIDHTNGTLEVRHATAPGPKAERSPHHFRRDLLYTQERALEIFDRDGSQWIGEWHTHLNWRLSPSTRDLATYHQHLRDPELGFDRFLAVIVGYRMRSTRTTAWVITRGTRKTRRIKLS